MKRLAAALALIALTTGAQAEQRTIYGPDGRVVGGSTTDARRGHDLWCQWQGRRP